jgi:hypothetical protein
MWFFFMIGDTWWMVYFLLGKEYPLFHYNLNSTCYRFSRPLNQHGVYLLHLKQHVSYLLKHTSDFLPFQPGQFSQNPMYYTYKKLLFLFLYSVLWQRTKELLHFWGEMLILYWVSSMQIWTVLTLYFIGIKKKLFL